MLPPPPLVRTASGVVAFAAMSGTLVILRHGQSEWNLANLFTGLARRRAHRARASPRRARPASRCARPACGSTRPTRRCRRRAVVTQNLALGRDGSVVAAGRTELAAERAPLRIAAGPRQEGDDPAARRRPGVRVAAQLRRATAAGRRSTAPSIRPTTLATAICPPDVLPASECLKDVVVRVLPYWYDRIAPQLLAGSTVLVTAHGNSLRALLKHLEGVSDDDIAEVNIPTGAPKQYRFDDASERVVGRVPRRRRRRRGAAAAVAAQAGTPDRIRSRRRWQSAAHRPCSARLQSAHGEQQTTPGNPSERRAVQRVQQQGTRKGCEGSRRDQDDGRHADRRPRPDRPRGVRRRVAAT